MNAIQLIKKDHRTVEALFKRFEGAGSDKKLKRNLVQEIITQLSIHAAIEEELLYPRARQVIPDGGKRLPKYLEEHHVAKLLLDELSGIKPDSDRFDAKVYVLINLVRQHIEREEASLLRDLDKALETQELEDLGDSLNIAKRAAPTRPHPYAPDTPPGNIVAGTMAAVVDRGRDVLMSLGRPSGRKELRAQVERAAQKMATTSGRRQLSRQETLAAKKVAETGRSQV
ncbi:MAG: hemerythrin domain-containing protein, partial [Myxococcaceae bacterium]